MNELLSKASGIASWMYSRGHYSMWLALALGTAGVDEVQINGFDVAFATPNGTVVLGKDTYRCTGTQDCDSLARRIIVATWSALKAYYAHTGLMPLGTTALATLGLPADEAVYSSALELYKKSATSVVHVELDTQGVDAETESSVLMTEHSGSIHVDDGMVVASFQDRDLDVRAVQPTAMLSMGMLTPYVVRQRGNKRIYSFRLSYFRTLGGTARISIPKPGAEHESLIGYVKAMLAVLRKAQESVHLTADVKCTVNEKALEYAINAGALTPLETCQETLRYKLQVLTRVATAVLGIH
ncbi:MAG: hypothetical protein QW196_02400 [Sulfolobales archaeon]